jgi:type II secretory pathway component PulC
MSRLSATPKEWAIAIGGGLALSAGLVLVLRGGGNDVPPPPVVATPAPVTAAPTPSMPPTLSAPPPTDLVLTGLRDGPDGGMAIIETGKRQYMLRPGRSLPGGLQLLRVEPGRAILAGPAGEMVLAFPDGKAGPASAAPTPPGGDPTPWRLALSPARVGGSITGWRLGSLAGLPQLAKAGFKVGDVLLSVDGSELISEEKIMELPQELATNGRVAIALKRDGKAMELAVTR